MLVDSSNISSLDMNGLFMLNNESLYSLVAGSFREKMELSAVLWLAKELNLVLKSSTGYTNCWRKNLHKA